MSDHQLELPGLEQRPDNSGDGPMVRATRQSIREWAAAGKLLPHHAVLTQLMLSLAQAIDGGARSGRASAVAMAAAQLREVVLQIDPPDDGGPVGGLELLRDFMGALVSAQPDAPLPAMLTGRVVRPDGTEVAG